MDTIDVILITFPSFMALVSYALSAIITKIEWSKSRSRALLFGTSFGLLAIGFTYTAYQLYFSLTK